MRSKTASLPKRRFQTHCSLSSLSRRGRPFSRSNSLQDQGQVEARSVNMSPESVLKIFRAISDADCLDLGLSPEFARPEWMIMTCLAVPPMTVRPSISMDGLAKGHDDLTHKLVDILKANTALKRFETEGVNALVLSEFEDLLQFHIATYMDNDTAGLPQALQKSGRPVLFFSKNIRNSCPVEIHSC